MEKILLVWLQNSQQTHCCNAAILKKVRSLCDSVDGMLIVDPTMASPKNSKVAELADALVNSLTKYASWEGDVMIGSLVFPEHSRIGNEIFEDTKKSICPLSSEIF